MASSAIYRGPADLPETIPVFPLSGALLLPRGRLPLNIFEPRYLAMVDDTLRGNRIIGMIQPDESTSASDTTPALYGIGCAGRLVSYEETGDGRFLITLLGVSRFRISEEHSVATPYRQCRVDYEPFAADFTPNSGEESVNREALLQTLSEYLKANKIEADWNGIRDAPTEALVNGLSMMSPYGAREKQALLEAPDLRARSELLIAVTEFALAEDNEDGDKPLQ